MAKVKADLEKVLAAAIVANYLPVEVEDDENTEKFSVDKEIAKVIYSEIETSKANSAWAKGVRNYACGLFETACDWIFSKDYHGETSDILYLKEKDLLDGASDWKE